MATIFGLVQKVPVPQSFMIFYSPELPSKSSMLNVETEPASPDVERRTWWRANDGKFNGIL